MRLDSRVRVAGLAALLIAVTAGTSLGQGPVTTTPTTTPTTPATPLAPGVIAPSVSIEGIDVSGLTQKDAEIKIAAEVVAPKRTPLVVVIRGRRIAIAPAAAGYRYFWDEESKQWAHATGVLLLAPDGRMARYLPGIEPFPRDLQFALLEASEGQIGTLVDRAVLYCYQYNESSGRYGAAIMRTLRLSALGTLVLLASFVAFSLRRERKAASSPTPA